MILVYLSFCLENLKKIDWQLPNDTFSRVVAIQMLNALVIFLGVHSYGVFYSG